MKVFLLAELMSFFISFVALSQDTIVNKYPDGTIASKGIIKWGAEYGHWKYWSKNGQLVQETDFSTGGIVHGKLIYYYPNGQKKSEGTFLFGHLDGPYNEWYENGKPKITGQYKREYKDSIWTYYYDNGQKRSQIEFTDSTERFINFWDKNGKQLIFNGNGEYITFYDDKQKK